LKRSKKNHYRKNICNVTVLFVGNGKLKIHPPMPEEAGTNYRVKKYVEYVQMCHWKYKLD